MSFGFRIGAATDVGVKRTLNQDSYGLSERLAVVADGMGGHRGGEVASAIAVNEVLDRFVEPTMQALVSGVEEANRLILDHGAANPELRGMGTTVVALAWVALEDGVGLGVINIGDSRMYRLQGKVLEQLTEDHSLVEALVREGRITAEEAELHPQRNIVTRALGVSDVIEIDDFYFTPTVGDRYLLCSDGLFNEVGAQQIATMLATEPDPQAAADQLIAQANIGGGRDNITTVIVDIVNEDDAAMAAVPLALAAPLPNTNVDTGSGDDGAAQVEVAIAGADDVAGMDTPQNTKRNRWSWRR